MNFSTELRKGLYIRCGRFFRLLFRAAERRIRDFGDFNRDVLTVRVVVWVDASYFRPATFFSAILVSFDSQRACEKNAACFRTLGLWLWSYFKFLIFAEFGVFSACCHAKTNRYAT